MVYAAIMPRLSPGLVGKARYQTIIERMGIPQPAQ